MLRKDFVRRIALGVGLALFSTKALPQQTAGQRVAAQAQQQRDLKLQRQVLEQQKQIQAKQLQNMPPKNQGCLILILGAGLMLISFSAMAFSLCR